MKLFAIPFLMISLLSSTFSMEKNLSFQEKTDRLGALTNSINFEHHFVNSNQDWVTLEKFTFHYNSSRKKHESQHILYLTNGFFSQSGWGEIAAYSLDAKICYASGSFSDGAPFTMPATLLSVLKYEYLPVTDQRHTPYFIVEKVNDAGGSETEGKGYSQACLKYFLDEFVAKCTNVNYVFSDLRNVKCQHFFPKYEFQLGMVEEFKDTTFARPMKIPSYWIKNKTI